MDMQQIEIDEHKWYLSQQYNRNVGYNEAVLDFISKGYAKLFRDKFISNQKEILACKDCGRLEKAIMEHDEGLIHLLLRDDIYESRN